jgi:hypothetical protein
MTAETRISEVVGRLVSQLGPRPLHRGFPVGGPRSDEDRIAALEHDVGRLYDGLMEAGREIERLREEVGDR